MQGTIIIQQCRIETNDERFDLSKKDIPVKTSNLENATSCPCKNHS
jgi:hypothetical protein